MAASGGSSCFIWATQVGVAKLLHIAKLSQLQRSRVVVFHMRRLTLGWYCWAEHRHDAVLQHCYSCFGINGSDLIRSSDPVIASPANRSHAG